MIIIFVLMSFPLLSSMIIIVILRANMIKMNQDQKKSCLVFVYGLLSVTMWYHVVRVIVFVVTFNVWLYCNSAMFYCVFVFCAHSLYGQLAIFVWVICVIVYLYLYFVLTLCMGSLPLLIRVLSSFPLSPSLFHLSSVRTHIFHKKILFAQNTCPILICEHPSNHPPVHIAFVQLSLSLSKTIAIFAVYSSMISSY